MNSVTFDAPLMCWALFCSFYHGEDIQGHSRVKWKPYDSLGLTLWCFFQLLLTSPVTKQKTNTGVSTPSSPLYLSIWSPGLLSCARLFSFWSAFLWMYLFAFPSTRASKGHSQVNLGFMVNFICSLGGRVLFPVPTSTGSLMSLLIHPVTK